MGRRQLKGRGQGEPRELPARRGKGAAKEEGERREKSAPRVYIRGTRVFDLGFLFARAWPLR